MTRNHILKENIKPFPLPLTPYLRGRFFLSPYTRLECFLEIGEHFSYVPLKFSTDIFAPLKFSTEIFAPLKLFLVPKKSVENPDGLRGLREVKFR